ncbi:hypothetical protein CPB83DRAFT_769780, partial [Crepidotus variabilis]
EERAIGYQLQCNICEQKFGKGGPEHTKNGPGYCFSTTSQTFWAKWEFWKIPASVPLFFHRSAVAHNLLDLIIELWPLSTSVGTAENIKHNTKWGSNLKPPLTNSVSPGILLFLDNTFKSAKKGVIVEKDWLRTKMMKGGILSVINELSETLVWRFCQSESANEICEILGGITKQHCNQGVAQPAVVVVDNCCHSYQAIQDKLPNTEVVLDVFTF